MFTQEQILRAYVILKMEYKLSERQSEIFLYLAHGIKDSEIEKVIPQRIGFDCIRTHHKNIYKKMQIHCIYELKQIAKKMGLA